MKQIESSATFEDEQRREIILVTQIMSQNLSLPLYLVFWIADWLYVPELAWQFLGLRLTLVPVCLGVNHFIGKTKSLMAAQNTALFFIFWNAFMITAMIIKTGDPGSRYYAGLNLVGIAGLSFIPWQWKYSALSLLVVYGPYLFYSVFSSYLSRTWTSFLTNIFFITGTVIISVAIRAFNNTLRQKEFSHRSNLGDELRHREEVIKIKSQEAVNLKTLSKQFSPQIVHAIGSGKLSLNEYVHRANITALFIDIVNSTQRIIRIDKDSTNAVISKFMDDAIKTMLKYDLTIDKFLGDGVLAFSNDPAPHPDHCLRTVMAAFEILHRIESNRVFYEDFWLAEFQIRIGVATGFANVGFYGNTEVYRSYTAIGPVMNLAARLCSTAAPSTVVVSNEVKKAIESTNSYSFSPLGALSLKGFEEDKLKAFMVTESLSQDPKSSEVETCPLCHRMMHLDVDMNGIYVFKCRDCTVNSLDQNKKTA